MRRAFFALLLFGAAGTLRWPAAWAYLAVLFGATLPMTAWLARRNPALLKERLKPPIQKGQPLWDKIVLSTLLGLFLCWFALMGLDARFRWSAMPVWLQCVGGLGLAVSLWLMNLAFRANTFLVPVVRIQAERGHTVVSGGPYAVVRHPLYSGALLFLAATALMLGSWWGLAGAGVLASVLTIRTELEDRELRRRLDGYAEYARRTRYKLVPLVW